MFLSQMDIQKGRTVYNLLWKLKPIKQPDDRKNVIYSLACKSCKQHYLGETQQISHLQMLASICSKI